MEERLNRSLRVESVAAGLLIAFLISAVALAYWSVVRAPALRQRGDNPRLVEAELRIDRGTILDVNGVVLAETISSDAITQRLYPITTIGPAVGYYSFRHGTTGVEESYSEVLQGAADTSWETIWNNALHRSQSGQDIRLTLDADWQLQADALLAGYQGALLILSVPDSAVKVLVSHPGYDPNRLDEQFVELTEDTQAPLLNRVTQGRYQPGLGLQPFIFAAALERDLINLDEPIADINTPVFIRNQISGCRETAPVEATWAHALRFSCPAPMIDLADSLRVRALDETLQRFGFYAPSQLPAESSVEVPVPITDTVDAILGQEALTITPLQMARAWVALAHGGVLQQPYLVREIQNAEGVWQMVQRPDTGVQVVEPSTATSVLAPLSQDSSGFVEHATTALSGPESETTAWYLGLTPAQNPRYAIVVVIEGAADSSAAREIGRAALQLAPSIP